MRSSYKAIGVALLGLLACSSAQAESYQYTVFNAPRSSTTLALGINNQGQIVGGNGSVGYVDTNGAFSTFSVPGSLSTQGYGINGLGQITGFYRDSAGFHSFEEAGGVFSAINAPGATSTFSFGINNAGSIVGNDSNSTGSFGYVDNGGVFTTISAPGAVVSSSSGTQAHGINNLGEIVGFYNEGVDPASGRNAIGSFTDKNGVITDFIVPGARATEAEGVNDRGEIVGTYISNGNPIGYGFVDNNGVFSRLAIAGASLTEAQGINDRGDVVGFEITGGKIHGFIANPVPESSTWAMMLLGFGGLGVFACRKARRGTLTCHAPRGTKHRASREAIWGRA